MISFSNNQNGHLEIVIEANKFSKKSTIILLIITVVSFLLPICFLIIGVKNNVTVSFTFIITLFIFWGTSWFFLKKFLWNVYGCEKYILKDNALVYLYDYKVYKEKFNESFVFNSKNFGFINDNGERKSVENINITYSGSYYFWIKGEKGYIDSTIPLNTKEDFILIKKLQGFVLKSI